MMMNPLSGSFSPMSAPDRLPQSRIGTPLDTGREDAARTGSPVTQAGAARTDGPDSEAQSPVNFGKSQVKSPGRKSSPADCETCKNRKYQDGSDEMVSFKSAAHISPQASGSRVRAHEQEHVANAFNKASQNNGKVISATVSIHTAVCPECGRTYVSGGETNTQIKYYNEENPYQQGKKTADASIYAGMNINAAL